MIGPVFLNSPYKVPYFIMKFLISSGLSRICILITKDMIRVNSPNILKTYIFVTRIPIQNMLFPICKLFEKSPYLSP